MIQVEKKNLTKSIRSLTSPISQTFFETLLQFSWCPGGEADGDGFLQSGRSGSSQSIQQRHQHGHQLPAPALRLGISGQSREWRKQKRSCMDWKTRHTDTMSEDCKCKVLSGACAVTSSQTALWFGSEELLKLSLLFPANFSRIESQWWWRMAQRCLRAGVLWPRHPYVLQNCRFSLIIRRITTSWSWWCESNEIEES